MIFQGGEYHLGGIMGIDTGKPRLPVEPAKIFFSKVLKAGIGIVAMKGLHHGDAFDSLAAQLQEPFRASPVRQGNGDVCIKFADLLA